MTELRVLVVEQNDHCSAQLASAAAEQKPTKYRIERCLPIDASELLNSEAWDLVVLDMHAETDPTTRLSEFRNNFPSVPIVVVLAGDDESLIESLLLLGAQDCMSAEQVRNAAVLSLLGRAFARSRFANVQRYKERVDLEQALHQFRLVFDAAPMFIWFKDLENRILLCNRSAAQSIGVTVEQIEGRLTSEFYPQEADEYYSDDLDVIESGEPKLGIIEQLQIRDEKILVETSKIPYRGSDGTVQGIIVLAHDITERLKLNQQREDFVATLAHDMKIPLIGANRILDLMLGGSFGGLDKSQSELLSKLRTSNESLLELIRKLLEVYRYEQGSKNLYFERFSVKALLQQCLAEMRAHAQASNLILDFEWDGSEPWVQADSLELRRVFLNLLDNAIKFTPVGGTITVHLRSVKNEFKVEVHDTGVGIPNQDQKKLFERFWQGEPGRKYPAGTGLGLYLSKRIVEAHKGRIWCKSAPGKGTTFSVALPLADSSLPKVS
jgi:PAS domain S-box-containing protein